MTKTLNQNETRKYIKITNTRAQKAILKRYENGELVKTIADDYGVDKATVRNIVRRLGGEIRGIGRPKGS